MAGYELANTTGLGEDLTGQLVVVLAAGNNPMTADVWETYVPPPGYSLNTPRLGWFNELRVLGSPYVPTGEFTYVTTSDGYTWESVAAVQRSVYPYIPITVDGETVTPQEIAYALTTPPLGVVIVDSNDKNHENVYYGTGGANDSEAHVQYFVKDLWGNTYILKSVNAANSTPELVEQAVANAVLPLGWTKPNAMFFSEDVIYGPSLSGPNDSLAHANEFRDSADNAWMQIEWAANGMTLNAAAEGGLPIWAGPLGGQLLGSPLDNMMYGAQGNDFIRGGPGNDSIDGGRGLNHSLYAGTHAEYVFARINDQVIEISDQVQDRDGTDSLIRVQRAQFSDFSMGFDVQAYGATGASYRLYSVLDRAPDVVGLGYWIEELDQGASLASVAQKFLDSAEYIQANRTSITDAQYVTQLYELVLQRNPDASGEQYWLEQLGNNTSRAQVLIAFSESTESIGLNADLLAGGAVYQDWIA